jgi:hypothetical protein
MQGDFTDFEIALFAFESVLMIEPRNKCGQRKDNCHDAFRLMMDDTGT